jgi:hypothetical protein
MNISRMQKETPFKEKIYVFSLLGRQKGVGHEDLYNGKRTGLNSGLPPTHQKIKRTPKARIDNRHAVYSVNTGTQVPQFVPPPIE